MSILENKTKVSLFFASKIYEPQLSKGFIW